MSISRPPNRSKPHKYRRIVHGNAGSGLREMAPFGQLVDAQEVNRSTRKRHLFLTARLAHNKRTIHQLNHFRPAARIAPCIVVYAPFSNDSRGLYLSQLAREVGPTSFQIRAHDPTQHRRLSNRPKRMLAQRMPPSLSSQRTGLTDLVTGNQQPPLILVFVKLSLAVRHTPKAGKLRSILSKSI